MDARLTYFKELSKLQGRLGLLLDHIKQNDQVVNVDTTPKNIYEEAPQEEQAAMSDESGEDDGDGDESNNSDAESEESDEDSDASQNHTKNGKKEQKGMPPQFF